MRPLPAFLRSGRFSVTVTTPASRSTMMVSVLTATPYPPAPGTRSPTASEGVLEDLDRQHPTVPSGHGGDVEPDLPVSRPWRCAPESHMVASWRRRRCLAGVTASKGEPKEPELRVFTSQNTRTSPSALRATTSSSPSAQRQLRSRTSYDAARYQAAAASSPRAPQRGAAGIGHLSCRGRGAAPRSRPGT